MADYFVKTTGNDGNNGTTWALAKATVQAGLNLCTTAGDRCVVAPGQYLEYNLAPPAPGTAGSHSTLYGDIDSTVTDGSAATSGVTPGYIKIDASSSTTGYSSNSPITASDNFAFWDWRGMWFTGGNASVYGCATEGVSNYGTTISDCIFESYVNWAFGVWMWDVSPDTPHDPITVSRCVMIGHYYYSPAPRYSSGGTACCKEGSLPTAPSVVFDRCYIVGTYAGVCVDGISAYRTHIAVTNCTIRTNMLSVTDSYAFQGSAASYSKVTDSDCILISHDVSINATMASTRQQTYLNAHTSTLDYTPLLPPIAYLWPGSAQIIDANGSNGTSPDLFGTTVSGSSRDYGAQEYVANRYPKEPTMIPGTQDIPDIGNVTEDDTSDGSTGTYHEATEAEVQNGVAFGAGSALTGTYVGGGGGRPEIRGGNL